MKHVGIIFLMLTLVCAFCLTGCKDKEEPISTATTTMAASTETTTVVTTTKPVQTTKSTTKKETTKSTTEQLCGGWSENTGEAMPERAKAAFEKASRNYDGMVFTPKKLLATQVVAGTNYKFLCNGTGVYPGAETKEYEVTVYEDLQGNCEITNVVER